MTVLLEDHDKTIWSGTRTGLYRLEQSGAQRVLQHIEIGMPDTPADRVIADLLEDSRHSLWIAAPSGLYRRWPDGSTARYTERDGLPASNVSDLLEDREGHLWAATRAGGFFRFSADDSHKAPTVDRRFSRTDGLSSDWVFQIFETSDRRLWVATSLGLSELLPDGNQRAGRFRTYDKRNGLPRLITTLAEDRGGNLWIGSQTTGAVKLARGGFATYGEPEGIASVSAVFEDQSGNVCFRGQVPGMLNRPERGVLGANPIADVARLGCFDGQRFDSFRPNTVTEAGWEEGLATSQVPVQTANGEWWVGTGEGLYRYPASPRLASLRIDPSAGGVHAGRRARDIPGLPALRGLARQRLGVHHLFDDDWLRPLGRSRWARGRPGGFTGTHVASRQACACVWRRSLRQRVDCLQRRARPVWAGPLHALHQK